MSKKIAIIGGGNLGTAIAEGLIQSGFVQPKHIIITKRNVSTLHQAKS
jgi:pyrroline-5-carboxylate reductase